MFVLITSRTRFVRMLTVGRCSILGAWKGADAGVGARVNERKRPILKAVRTKRSNTVYDSLNRQNSRSNSYADRRDITTCRFAQLALYAVSMDAVSRRANSVKKSWKNMKHESWKRESWKHESWKNISPCWIAFGHVNFDFPKMWRGHIHFSQRGHNDRTQVWFIKRISLSR